MGVRAKIFSSLFLLGVTLSAYLGLIWVPGYLHEERSIYIAGYQAQLDLLAAGIGPEFAEDEGNSVHARLDKVLAKYPAWRSFLLMKKSGKVLVNTRNPNGSGGEDVVSLQSSVDLSGGMGLLRATVDVGPAIEGDREGVYPLMWSFLALALLSLIPIAWMLDRWLRRPLIKLAAVSAEMGRGNFAAELPSPSNDEVGLLVRDFASMREAISKRDGELKREIIARKRIQQELFNLNDTLEKEVEERVRELKHQKFALDEHCIVSVANREGAIIYVNDKFCKNSGYDRQEILGRDHRMFNSGYHAKAFFEDLWSTISSGKVWAGEIRNCRKDGSHFWAYTTIVPFMDEDGLPYQYVSIRTDVTDRKNAEAERLARTTRLKKQQQALLGLIRSGLFDEDDFVSVLENVTCLTAHTLQAERVGVWFFNVEATLLRCEVLYQYSADKFENGASIAKSDFPAYFATLEEGLLVVVNDVASDERIKEFKHDYLDTLGVTSLLNVPIRVSGQLVGVISVESTGSARIWHSDQQHFSMAIANMVALALEEARRSEVETQLKDTARKLELTNKDLDMALVEARDAVRVKSVFVAMMSHEVRTPINAILGILGLLQESNLQGLDKECVDTAYHSAKALLKLLNDVLDFSKIEAGQLQMEAVDFDPHQMIDEAIEMMEGAALAKHITITTEYDPVLPVQIYSDPLRFEQVVINLIGNAIKFTDNGGVTIKTFMGEDVGDRSVLRVEVQDTGVGIPAGDQERIFDAFAQVGNYSAAHYGGTGLGLDISRRLVAMMGGQIGVVSKPGEGSTFWFTVPVTSRLAVRKMLAG